MYKFIITFALATLISGCKLSDTENKKLELSSDNKTRYKIVLCSDPLPAETTASKELKKYLKKITGINFEIKLEKDINKETGNIYIGPCRYVKKNFPELDFNKIEPDRIIIKTVGGNLILAGGRPRGTLYAVFTFLEDTLGCRWWTSKASSIPVKKNISIPCLDIDYTPVFKDFRETHYLDVNKNPAFAAKLKSQGLHQNIKNSEKFGGAITFVTFPSHNFFRLLPPAKYFNKNPEWYSMNAEGIRYHKNGQLCLTNSRMKHELINILSKKFAKNNGKGYAAFLPNDKAESSKCLCEACTSLENTEGSYSGPLIQSANTLISCVNKTYPEAKLAVSAYRFFQKPPRHIKANKNVTIRFATSRFCVYFPFNSPENKNRNKYFKGWRKKAPSSKFHIWDYHALYRNYIQPHPNYKIVDQNIKYFAQNNVSGVMIQGDGHCPVGDFVHMRAWVTAHLLWNPQANYEKLRTEFLQGYYGEAAPYIRKYLDLLEKTVKDKKVLTHSQQSTIDFMTRNVIRKASSLLLEASKAVKNNKVIQKRLNKAVAPLLYASIVHSLKEGSKTGSFPLTGHENTEKAITELEKMFSTYKVERIAETKKSNRSNPSFLIKILKNSTKKAKNEFQEIDFKLFGLASYIEDSEASNKLAANLPGNSSQWLLQVPMSKDNIPEPPFNIIVRARCKFTGKIAKCEPIFAFGISNEVKKTIFRKDIKDQKYHTYILHCSTPLNTEEKTKIWIAPTPRQKKHSEAFKALIIDRFFIQPEKKERKNVEI